MNRSAKTVIIAAIGILSITANSAFAETWWEKTHPRRDQVNDRLENQDRRINQELHEGEISPWRAARLHQEDHSLRNEERAMATFDHGHITRGEERALNQQENNISGRIGN
jgi:hypothetical protein